MDEVRPRAIFVGFLAGLLRAAQEPEIAELIATGDCLIVDHCGAGCPAGDDVIGERNEFIFLVLVDNIDHAFLYITDDDAGTLRLEPINQVRDRSGLAFPEQLFETKIVDADFGANASEEAALEGEEGLRRLFDFGFVDKFKLFAVFEEAVDVNKAGGEGAGSDDHVLAGAHDEERFVVLAGERYSGNTGCSFVVCQVDLL